MPGVPLNTTAMCFGILRWLEIKDYILIPTISGFKIDVIGQIVFFVICKWKRCVKTFVIVYAETFLPFSHIVISIKKFHDIQQCKVIWR